MSAYRKVDARIWMDREFRSMSSAEKVAVLHRIMQGNEPVFSDYMGPVFRVATGPRRRPDLSSARWRSVREEVIRQFGKTCHYCGCDCSDDTTVDHVIPVSEGHDPFDRANLVVACRPCNSSKGPRMTGGRA